MGSRRGLVDHTVKCDAALSFFTKKTQAQVCKVLRIDSLPPAVLARLDSALKLVRHEQQRKDQNGFRFSDSKEVRAHFDGIEKRCRKLLTLMRRRTSAEGLFLRGPRRGQTLDDARARMQRFLEDLEWAATRAAVIRDDSEQANFIVGLLPAANPKLSLVAARLWPLIFEVWESYGNRVHRVTNGRLEQLVLLIHEAGGLEPPALTTLDAAIKRWQLSKLKSGKKSGIPA